MTYIPSIDLQQEEISEWLPLAFHTPLGLKYKTPDLSWACKQTNLKKMTVAYPKKFNQEADQRYLFKESKFWKEVETRPLKRSLA